MLSKTAQQTHLALLSGSDLGCLGSLACLNFNIAGLLLGQLCLVLGLIPGIVVSGIALQEKTNSVSMACVVTVVATTYRETLSVAK